MLRLMRPAFVAGLAAAAVAVLPQPAAGQSGPSGWDGTNPFACTLQQVGTGTDFPQPNADPFCVEFEKRHQNVTQLGVVDFLSKEPARVAAASDKCFYFQSDHWRGSVAQDQPGTETYAWDGHYYFNKATGSGGVYVENFRFAGQTGDPTALPGFPEEYKKYFSSGRGGFQSTGDVQADPRCATRPNPSGPGGGSGGGSGGGGSAGGGGESKRCRVPGGRVGRGIGGVRLGMRRAGARRDLGLPVTESTRWMVWCFDGGGRLAAALPARGERAQVNLVLTTASAFDTHGIRPTSRAKTARRRLRGERRIGLTRGVTVFSLSEKGRRLLVGIRKGRVRFLAVARPAVAQARLLRYLRVLR
jgi:uncharacterized membrane protein YgcG